MYFTNPMGYTPSCGGLNDGQPFGQGAEAKSPMEAQGDYRIACQCLHQGEFAIALCCDWQATYGQSLKSEDQHKIRNAGRAAILIADDPAAADEVVARLTKIFEAYDKLEKNADDFDLRITKLLADIRAIISRINAERRDYLLRTKYNTTAELFRTEGRGNFPSDMYFNILSEIGKIGIGCRFNHCLQRGCRTNNP